MKDYLKEKMESEDQAQRELEISRLVQEQILQDQIKKANRENNNLDKALYEKEVLKI